MRSCRHCAHENADHLAYCSQCGRKLPRTDGGLPVVSRRMTGDPGAYSRTMLATPGPAATTRDTVGGARTLFDRPRSLTTPSSLGLGGGARPPPPPAPR